jgi:hypothetical protein
MDAFVTTSKRPAPACVAVLMCQLCCVLFYCRAARLVGCWRMSVACSCWTCCWAMLTACPALIWAGGATQTTCCTAHQVGGTAGVVRQLQGASGWDGTLAKWLMHGLHVASLLPSCSPWCRCVILSNSLAAHLCVVLPVCCRHSA